MLKRFAVTFSVLGVFVLAGLAGGAQDGKMTIKQAMGKLHGKKGGLLPSVKSALKSSPPDWKVIGTKAKEMVVVATAIELSDPPKGDKADYEKLAKVYTTNAKALSEAADAEDLPKAAASAKKIGMSCKACHDAHKE